MLRVAPPVQLHTKARGRCPLSHILAISDDFCHGSSPRPCLVDPLVGKGPWAYGHSVLVLDGMSCSLRP